MYEDFSRQNDAGKIYSKKSWKRNMLEKGLVAGRKQKIIMLIGDTLDDIGLDPVLFQQPVINPANTQSLSDLGRTRFIIPNPVYDRGWLRRLYQRQKAKDYPRLQYDQLTPIQLAILRKNAIKPWVNDTRYCK